MDALPRYVMLATLVASITSVLPASALQETTGLQISPVKVERDITGSRFDADLIVRNVGSTSATVTTRVSGLGHDLQGAVTFPSDDEAEAAIDVRAGEFELAPQERVDLSLDGRIPDGRVATYVAFVAETSVDETSAAGTLTSITQVATTFLIRGPRPWQEEVRIDDVGFLSQSRDDGPVQLFADVFNTGNVHVEPEGRMTVRYGNDRADEISLTGVVILPGYARRFLAEWTPPAGLEGPVTVVVELRNPDATSEHRFDYPPELALDFEVDSLTARKDEEGDLRLDAALRNTGRDPIGGITGELLLSEGPGGITAGPFVSQLPEGLEPDAVDELTFVLDEDIPLGPWLATVTATSGGVEKSAEARIEFPAGAGESADAVAAGPVYRDRSVVLPVAVGLLFLTLFLVFLVWWLKRRRDEEDEERGDEGAGREHATAVAEE